MAGVEFAKRKLSAISSGDADIHFDLSKRSVCDHSNISIDRTKSQDNYYMGHNWTESKQIFSDTVDYADTHHPCQRKTSSRKEIWFLDVVCPQELEETPNEDLFYAKAYEMYAQYLPVVGGEVHKDEKHEYYDPQKKEMIVSRNHMHIWGVCITADGRCHTSDCITPQLCQKVNDDIQQLCLDTWGISYQTGEGRKGAKKTVEQIKAMSETSLQAKLAKEKIEIVQTKTAEAEVLDENIKAKSTAVSEMDEIVAMNTQMIANQDRQIGNQQAQMQDNAKILEHQTGVISANKQKIAESEEKIEDLNAKSDQIAKIQRDTVAEIQKMGKEAEEKEARVRERVAKAEKALALAENQAKIIVDNAQNQADVLVDNAREHAVDIYLDKTRAYHEEELKALKSIVANPNDRNAVQKMVDYMRDKASKFGVTLMTNIQEFECSIITKLGIADAIYATQAEGISMYVGKNGLSDKQMDYIARQFDKFIADQDPEHDWMRECYANQYGGDDFKDLWVSRVKFYCEAHPAQRINSAIPQINKTEQAMVKMSAGVANYLVSSIQRSVNDYEYER